MFKFLKKRKIRNVVSWDGSSSNYSTPQSYAKASLINLNQGDPSNWTKNLIKLPVRNERDSSDTYIKQAVQAAAGGRGITAVKKPVGISQEKFSAAVKSAANEIIRAYKEWGGTAPDSIFKIAGKDTPKERALAFSSIYDKVYDLVLLADLAEKEKTILYDLYFDETGEKFYALGIREGIVYRIEVLVRNDDIMLGEFEKINFRKRDKTEQKIQVFRGKDNQMRWLSIASVAVLNRIGEIDSTKLFDSFIDYAERTNNFPYLTVYHLGPGSEVGEADFLARHGYVYIAGGYFYDDPIGQATYRGLQGRDDWGNSIEFYSPTYDVENFELDGNQIQVPIYSQGINTAITLLREKDAASVFTIHKVRGKEADG